MSALFTVCIPTFNRAEKLSLALSAILSQAESHRGVFSVYVSDNCSEDGTPGVVADFQSRYPGCLSYKRQPSNLGSEANYRDAIASVDSRYVAIMGDDDIAMPDYVDSVLAAISAHPDVALVNVNMLSFDAGRYLKTRDPQFLLGKGRFYEKGGAFILEHNHCPSQMSSNVFLREEFLRTAATVDPQDYPGYGWLMTLLKGVLDRPVVYLDRPLVWADGSSCTNWECEAPMYYIVGLGRMFRDLDQDYPGLAEMWKDVFSRSWMPAACLDFITRHRDRYRDRIESMRPYFISESYYRRARECVFSPLAWLKLKRVFRRGLAFFRRATGW